MGTETVTQYETVEREEEVIFCDDCSANEDERLVIPVSINAHRGEQEEAQGIIYQDNQPALVKDLCAECIEQQFDLDIPDKGKVESFNVEPNGDVKIENITEKNAIFSSLTYARRRHFIYDIVLMPLLFFVCTLGDIEEWQDNENVDYGFVVGVLGGIVWSLVSILLLINFGFL